MANNYDRNSYGNCRRCADSLWPCDCDKVRDRCDDHMDRCDDCMDRRNDHRDRRDDIWPWR